MIPYEKPLTRAEKRRAMREEKKLNNKYPQPVRIYTEQYQEVDGVRTKGYMVRTNIK
jgi:hypothetical protein